MKVFWRLVAAIALACITSLTHAAYVWVSVVPSTWRVENFVNGTVIVWLSGSPCSSGKLTLAAGATVNDYNRFYATIMAAKTANTKIFVYYDKDHPECPTSSFGVPEN